MYPHNSQEQVSKTKKKESRDLVLFLTFVIFKIEVKPKDQEK